MKLKEEQIIKKIVTRLKGVIDEEKAKSIYKASNITVNGPDDIIVEGKPNFVLDKLLRTLLKEGNYLVKITLHNIAQENNISICPLCKEMNETGKVMDKKGESVEEDNDKDLTVKMLHSTKSKKIVLIKLKNKASLDDHAADCPITVLCLSGHGIFEYNGKSQDLAEGDVINLDARVVHNVQAKNQLEILVTKFLAA